MTRVVAVVWLLVALGCGGSDKVVSTVTLGADATTITVPAGGSQTLNLTLARTGLMVGAAVSLGATDLPDGVTATLATTPTTSDTATVTFAAAYTASATTVTTHVVASAESETSTVDVVLTVGPPSAITVSGNVVGWLGRPAATVGISIWSAGATTATTVTTIDGSFSVDGVLPPYDLLASVTAGDELVLGLTRADPTVILVALDNPQSIDANAQINAHVTPTVTPDADTNILFDIDCGSVAAFVNSATEAVSLQLSGVPAGFSFQCTGKALRFEHAAGAISPSSYVGFVAKNLSVAANGTTNVTFDLGGTSAATQDIQVHAVTSSGGPVPLVTLAWLADADTVQTATSVVDNAATDFVMTIPASDAGLLLQTQGATDHGATTFTPLLAATPSVSVTLPDPPVLTSPDNGATGVDPTGASLVVAEASGALYAIVLIDADVGTPLIVVSASNTVSAAELTARDHALAGGITYDWAGYVFPGISSSDAFASHDATWHGMASRSSGYGLSETWSFTTQD